jgi:hypothetical protein
MNGRLAHDRRTAVDWRARFRLAVPAQGQENCDDELTQYWTALKGAYRVPARLP